MTPHPLIDAMKGNAAPVAGFVDYLRVKYPAQRVVVPGHAEAVMLKRKRSAAGSR